MTVRSGIFNSMNGDRKYDATKFAEYFASFIGNGIFPEPENSLKINANNNMTVTVQAGKAWINGYFLVNDDIYILAIENADGALNRIDRIIARYDVIDREIRLEVKKGTFSSSPSAPDMQRDSDAYELALADVYISAGATSIIQANITDLRNNPDYCGIVDSLIAGNVNLLSDRIDAIDIVLPDKLDKTGDGKDITVTFTEASVEADIASGEKLSVMFGKIFKKFKNIINGTTAVAKAVTLDGLVATIAQLNFVQGVTSAIQTQLNGKAPTSHASTGTGYGVGTAANYGHVKTINNLTQASHVDGTALSAYQGKLINDKLPNLIKTQTITLSKAMSAVEITGDFSEYDQIIFKMTGNFNLTSNGTFNPAGVYWQAANESGIIATNDSIFDISSSMALNITAEPFNRILILSKARKYLLKNNTDPILKVPQYLSNISSQYYINAPFRIHALNVNNQASITSFSGSLTLDIYGIKYN